MGQQTRPPWNPKGGGSTIPFSCLQTVRPADYSDRLQTRRPACSRSVPTAARPISQPAALQRAGLGERECGEPGEGTPVGASPISKRSPLPRALPRARGDCARLFSRGTLLLPESRLSGQDRGRALKGEGEGRKIWRPTTMSATVTLLCRTRAVASGRTYLRSASTWAKVASGPPDPILGECARRREGAIASADVVDQA